MFKSALRVLSKSPIGFLFFGLIPYRLDNLGEEIYVKSNIRNYTWCEK
jgi:hypothetical protein